MTRAAHMLEVALYYKQGWIVNIDEMWLRPAEAVVTTRAWSTIAARRPWLRIRSLKMGSLSWRRMSRSQIAAQSVPEPTSVERSLR